MLIFYGMGLGLFGELTPGAAWLVVPLVWVLMLAWSKPWLDHFHMARSNGCGAAWRAGSFSRCGKAAASRRRRA